MRTVENCVSVNKLAVAWRDREYAIAALTRAGKAPALYYFPGLGCAKEDFLALAETPELAGQAFAALDFPGHGASPYPEGVRLTLDDCAGIAAAVADALALERPVLVAHSMGGAVGLLYAEQYPVGGFISIEGNLRPENCSFSREAKRRTFAAYAARKLPAYLAKLWQANRPELTRYADSLARCSPRAIYDLGDSLVDYSDGGRLLERFLELAAPTVYVHGDKNRMLTYLPLLAAAGGAVAEISRSGHFPQLDNPPAVAAVIGEFLRTRVGLPGRAA